MRYLVDDVELEVDVHGSTGPVLLLVHGLGGSRRTWDAVIPHLASRARVYVPDLRGCGKSTRGSAPYTLARVGDDLEGLAAAAGIDPAIVVGHSLGGVVAQELLVRPAGFVAAAALVSTSSRLNEKATENWRRLADMVEAKGLSDSPSAAARGFAEDYADQHPEVVAEHAAITAATNPKVYAEQARAASSYDYGPALAGVAVPVLVMQGLADRLTPPGGSVLLHRALGANARLEMLEGAGHNLPVEMPERFAEILLDFARSHGIGD